MYEEMPDAYQIEKLEPVGDVVDTQLDRAVAVLREALGKENGAATAESSESIPSQELTPDALAPDALAPVAPPDSNEAP